MSLICISSAASPVTDHVKNASVRRYVAHVHSDVVQPRSQGMHPALFSPAWVSIALNYVMGKAQQ